MVHATVLLTGLLMALVGDAPDPSQDLKTYDALKAKAGKDSQGHVKMALWCEAHGLDAERVRHLALAVLADPRNPTARGLLGLVAFGGRWETADRARERARADEARTAKLAEYEKRRSRLTADEINRRQAADRIDESGDHEGAATARLGSHRRLAQAHVELGLWCNVRGLKPEATAHFTMAVHLDPNRDTKWRLLGYVKRNGRWIGADQAEAEEREALAQKQADRYWEPLLKKWLAWLGDRGHRQEAEHLLATVTDRRALPSILRLVPGDRAEADQLRRVRLLAQVDDPTSSRALAHQAVWTHSSTVRQESIEILKGRPTRDYAGQLVEMIRGPIRYQVQSLSTPDSPGMLAIETPRFRMVRNYAIPPAFQLACSFRGYVGLSPNGRPVVAQGAELDLMKREFWNTEAIAAKIQEIEVRTARMLAQSAQAAQLQMASDISDIEIANQQTRVYNANIAPVLESAAGAPTTLGDDEDAWRGWWFDTLGYNYQASPKPTITQIVETQYQPYSISTCFAAGTPVQTLDGERPIEAIQVGDQVLSQDDATGALSFQPVGVVHRNPPGKTLRINLADGQSVVCSVYHRFWRAHLGWAMARDLKPGDTLRTLVGIVRVEGIVSDSVQPLYNLEVAGSRTFFAGRTILLVHDNTLPDHRLKPFDALPILEAASLH